jgi:hypothetical protein
MRTKLILGLIAGLVAAAQNGSAQGVFTSTDLTDSAISSYFDAAPTSWQQDSLSQKAGNGVVRRQSQQDESLLNWDGISLQDSILTTAYGDGFVSSPSSFDDTDRSMDSSVRGGGPPGGVNPQDPGPPPTPEPNTVVMLVMGGAALAARTFGRRK